MNNTKFFNVMVGHFLTESQQQLCKALEETGECRVTFSTHDGSLLLQRLQAERPDLVVLSAMLVGMDGLELVARMKKLGLPTKCILLLTGRSQYIQSQADCMEADYCLFEPCSYRSVAGHAHRLLTSRLSCRGGEIEFETRAILMDISSPGNLKGYHYTLAGVCLVCQDPSLIAGRQATKRLYPAMGEAYGVSSMQPVEHAMRTFIDRIWARAKPEMLERYFGTQADQTGKPVTTAFLAALAEQVTLRLRAKEFRGNQAQRFA